MNRVCPSCLTAPTERCEPCRRAYEQGYSDGWADASASIAHAHFTAAVHEVMQATRGGTIR
jgi:hypothetical protein